MNKSKQTQMFISMYSSIKQLFIGKPVNSYPDLYQTHCVQVGILKQKF